MARLRHLPRTTVAFERSLREAIKMGKLVTTTTFPLRWFVGPASPRRGHSVQEALTGEQQTQVDAYGILSFLKLLPPHDSQAGLQAGCVSVSLKAGFGGAL